MYIIYVFACIPLRLSHILMLLVKYIRFSGQVGRIVHKIIKSSLSCRLQLFKGNTDGNSIRRNNFEVPIIARWIRINPLRWKNSISMRVELYGCNYGRHLDFRE